MTTPAVLADAASSARPLSLEPWTRRVAVAVIALLGTYLAAAIGGRQASLFLVGVFAGVALYHAAFGFTSSWRRFIVEGQGAGLRAQMLMLALTCLVFFPALARGELFGQAVRGSVSPIGVGVVFGAFLFGIGMQLGGGCASGTLYTAGGGSVRMMITLVAFVAGAVLGAVHLPWWEQWPAAKPLSLVTRFGAPVALAISLAAFCAVAAATYAVEARRGPSARLARRSTTGARRLLEGPWPLAIGAASLAIVNILTLALAGRPWGITSALTLWGAKLLAAAGAPVESWRYFAAPARRAELHATVFKDVTSVMNFGIMLGAFAAAAFARRFAPSWRTSARAAAASIAGGLLLGYGARIAYGCNIGAFFSGIASGSLHGWVWFPAALAGNVLGTRLRPMFGLANR
jgi:uncharacterized membrane protein YedE/YeeE